MFPDLFFALLFSSPSYPLNSFTSHHHLSLSVSIPDAFVWISHTKTKERLDVTSASVVSSQTDAWCYYSVWMDNEDDDGGRSRTTKNRFCCPLHNFFFFFPCLQTLPSLSDSVLWSPSLFSSYSFPLAIVFTLTFGSCISWFIDCNHDDEHPPLQSPSLSHVALLPFFPHSSIPLVERHLLLFPTSW